MVRRFLLGFAALLAAVLGWGYWQARSHADVWLQVKDHAGRTPNRLWADATDARVQLRDAAGRTLAEAALVPPQGLPRYTGPAGAVDCNAQQQGGKAWQECHERHSRWVAGWAPKITNARVSVGACVVDPVPVTRKRYTDWWFWWVPLPHGGGSLGHHYTVSLHLDSVKCSAVAAPY